MNLSDVFSARNIVAYVNTMEPSTQGEYLGEMFFPNKKIAGIDLSWIKSRKGRGVILAPSNYDAMPTIRSRGGFQLTNTQMPFFRESMKVGEKDELEIQRATSTNDPYVASVLASVYDDANTLVTGARVAAEAMRMQLLSAANNGKPGISIGTKDNMLYVYDYDANGEWMANHYMNITTTADQWDQATSKPLTDIDTGVAYLKSIGYKPKYLLMTTKTFRLLRNSDEVKAALITFSGQAVARVNDRIVSQIVEDETGLTPILYDNAYIDYAGQSQNFYPDFKASIISDGEIGYTFRGITPEERTLLADPTVDVSVLDSGIAVTVKNTYGPPVQHETVVSQVALPSFEGMDGVYVIKAK